MPYGKLDVICGPMFSGKSTSLLRRILGTRAQDERNALVLKPAFDTRYGEDRVTSHDGMESDAIAIAEWPEIGVEVDLVFIDEVQFLCAPYFRGDAVREVQSLLRRGVDVVAAGLDTDWRGEAFEVTARLMAMADRVEKRFAMCAACGRQASKTFKKVRNGRIVELGQMELYEARCNEHWSGSALPDGREAQA